MTEVNIFFKKLLAKRNSLSSLESQVLEYILQYPNKVIEKNIEEFANEIFVSTATVSRTCKKLGFKGYQQLKYALSQYTIARGKEEQEHSSSRKSNLDRHLSRFKKEINDTLLKINQDKISQVAKLLEKSNFVEFFGVGASYPSCIDAARKLTFAGKISSARNDWDELRAVAKSLTEKDLAIFISHSGETLHLIEYASILNERKVPFILLAGVDDSYLESMAKVTIAAYSESYYYDEIDMSSRFTINLLMDLILFQYLDALQ